MDKDDAIAFGVDENGNPIHVSVFDLLSFSDESEEALHPERIHRQDSSQVRSDPLTLKKIYDAGENADRQPKSLADLIDQKCDYAPENYQIAWNQFYEFLGREEVTMQKVVEFRDALISGTIGRKYAPSSVTLKIKAIKSLIRNVLADNPEMSQIQAFRIERELNSIKCPTIPVSASRLKILSRQQIQKLLHECPDKKVLPLIKTILLNGCLLNEALQLSHKGLKRSEGDMWVHRGIIAKGGKEIHLRMTEEIRQEILDLDIFTGTKWFPWTRKAATIRIKRAIEMTLGMNASAYSLRHSFAILALEEGISLQEISVWLNHTSPKSTAQYYLQSQRSEAGNRFSRGLIE